MARVRACALLFNNTEIAHSSPLDHLVGVSSAYATVLRPASVAPSSMASSLRAYRLATARSMENNALGPSKLALRAGSAPREAAGAETVSAGLALLALALAESEVEKRRGGGRSALPE